jgi:hypothetical protein
MSDRPLYNTEGASGGTLLQIEIAEAVVGAYEWTEKASRHREWLVPAGSQRGRSGEARQPLSQGESMTSLVSPYLCCGFSRSCSSEFSEQHFG